MGVTFVCLIHPQSVWGWEGGRRGPLMSVVQQEGVKRTRGRGQMRVGYRDGTQEGLVFVEYDWDGSRKEVPFTWRGLRGGRTGFVH